jgi:hypothetical protein
MSICASDLVLMHSRSIKKQVLFGEMPPRDEAAASYQGSKWARGCDAACPPVVTDGTSTNNRIAGRSNSIARGRTIDEP